MDSFDEPGIMPCPHCRKMVSEEAEVCSHCGEYISAEDAPRKPLPIWFWIALVAGFVALLVMMIR
jgi:predicted nucleic acid-binding Zn ribbon protein